MIFEKLNNTPYKISCTKIPFPQHFLAFIGAVVYNKMYRINMLKKISKSLSMSTEKGWSKQWGNL